MSAEALLPKLFEDDMSFEDYTARPDWRWMRAMTLFSESEKPVIGMDDKYVVKAYRYIMAFEDTENLSQ